MSEEKTSVPAIGPEVMGEDPQMQSVLPIDAQTLGDILALTASDLAEAHEAPLAPAVETVAANDDIQPLDRKLSQDEITEATAAQSMEHAELFDRPNPPTFVESAQAEKLADDPAQARQLEEDIKDARGTILEPMVEDSMPQPLSRKQSKKDKKKAKAAQIADFKDEVQPVVETAVPTLAESSQGETPAAEVARSNQLQGDFATPAYESSKQQSKEDVLQPLSRKQSKKDKKKARAARLSNLEDEVEPAARSAEGAQAELQSGPNAAEGFDDSVTVEPEAATSKCSPSPSQLAAEEEAPFLGRKQSKKAKKKAKAAESIQQDDEIPSTATQAEASQEQVNRDLDAARDSAEPSIMESSSFEPHEATEDVLQPSSRKQSKKDKKKAAKAHRLASFEDDSQAFKPSVESDLAQSGQEGNATETIVGAGLAEDAEKPVGTVESASRDIDSEVAFEPLSRKQSKKEKKKAKASRLPEPEDGIKTAMEDPTKVVDEELLREPQSAREVEHSNPPQARVGDLDDRLAEKDDDDLVEDHDAQLLQGKSDAPDPFPFVEDYTAREVLGEVPAQELEPINVADDASHPELTPPVREVRAPVAAHQNGEAVEEAVPRIPGPENEGGVGGFTSGPVSSQALDDEDEAMKAPLPPSPKISASTPDDISSAAPVAVGESIMPVYPTDAAASNRQSEVFVPEPSGRSIPEAEASQIYTSEEATPDVGHVRADIEGVNQAAATGDPHIGVDKPIETSYNAPLQEPLDDNPWERQDFYEIVNGTREDAILHPDVVKQGTVEAEPTPIVDDRVEPAPQHFATEPLETVQSYAEPLSRERRGFDDVNESLPALNLKQTLAQGPVSIEPDPTGQHYHEAAEAGSESVPKHPAEGDFDMDANRNDIAKRAPSNEGADETSTKPLREAAGSAIAGAAAGGALAAYASRLEPSEASDTNPEGARGFGEDDLSQSSDRRGKKGKLSSTSPAELEESLPKSERSDATETPMAPKESTTAPLNEKSMSPPPEASQAPTEDSQEQISGKKSKKDKKKKAKQVFGLPPEASEPASRSESQGPEEIVAADEFADIPVDPIAIQDANLGGPTDKKGKKEKKKKGKQIFDLPSEVLEPPSRAESAALEQTVETTQPTEMILEQSAGKPPVAGPSEAVEATLEPAVGKKGKKDKKKKGKQVFDLPAETDSLQSRAENPDDEGTREDMLLPVVADKESSREVLAQSQGVGGSEPESAPSEKSKKKKKGKEIFDLPTEPLEEVSEGLLQPEDPPLEDVAGVEATDPDQALEDRLDPVGTAPIQATELQQCAEEGDFAPATRKKDKKAKKSGKAKEVFDLPEEPAQPTFHLAGISDAPDSADTTQRERDLPVEPLREEGDLLNESQGAEVEEIEAAIGKKSKKGKKDKEKQSFDFPEDPIEPVTVAGEPPLARESGTANEPQPTPLTEFNDDKVASDAPRGAGEDELEEAVGQKGKKGKKKSKSKQVVSLIEEPSQPPTQPIEGTKVREPSVHVDHPLPVDESAESRGIADHPVLTTEDASRDYIHHPMPINEGAESRDLVDGPPPISEAAHTEQETIAEPQDYETTAKSPQESLSGWTQGPTPPPERKRPHSPSPVRERRLVADAIKQPVDVEPLEGRAGQETQNAMDEAPGPAEADLAQMSRKASKKAKKKKGKQASDWPDESPEDVSRSLSLKGTARTAGTVGAGVAIFEGMQRAASISEQHEREHHKVRQASDTSAERPQLEGERRFVEEPAAMDIDAYERGRSLSPRQRDTSLRDSALQMPDTPLPAEPPALHRLVRDSGYQGADDSPILGEETQARSTGLEEFKSDKRRSPEHPLHVSVEASPEYDVSVFGPRGAHIGRPRSDSGELPTHSTHRAQDYPSPARSPLDREPSPVDSMTKDRSAVLFDSSPSIRDTPSYQRAPELPATPLSPRHDSEEREGDASRAASGSLFGGPVGIDSDREAMRSPHTPMPFGSAGPPLATITEQSPEDTPLRQKSRGPIEAGSNHGDGRRRSRLGARSPHSGRQLGLISTDDLISRLSWPDVDEENHSVDLERSRSRNTDKERRLSGQRKKLPLATEAGKHDGERRSISGASVRSQDSINAIIRSPPISATDVTPPHLRHANRSVSSDLRAAARQSEPGSAVGSEGKRSDDAKPRKASASRDHGDRDRGLGAAAVAAAAAAGVGVASSSTYDPVTDKGKGPITKMTDVYVSIFWNIS